MADAGAHPWTVVVMYLDAEAALTAVIAARRSDNLASGAIG